MSPTPSNDQPIGHARPRAALLIHHARRAAGHGAVTPETATARISSDLWPDLARWLGERSIEGINDHWRDRRSRVSFAGYRCIEDPDLPPDTVRLKRTP